MAPNILDRVKCITIFKYIKKIFELNIFKGRLYGPRQFLITESLLKMIKNAFYFTLKALFVLKIFKLLSRLFGHMEKTARLER